MYVLGADSAGGLQKGVLFVEVVSGEPVSPTGAAGAFHRDSVSHSTFSLLCFTVCLQLPSVRLFIPTH